MKQTIRFFAALLFAVIPVTTARSGDAAARSDGPIMLQARNLLSDDRVLGKFNIGVRVTGGVATLFGPVPTLETAAHAVKIVKRVPGVVEVRNELYLPAADAALARAMPIPVTTQRLPTPVESLPIVPPTPALPTAQPVSRSLADQIDRLRQRDRRFADIKVEVRDGRVTLSGFVVRSRDAWEFADLIGNLPAVAGVVMKVHQR